MQPHDLELFHSSTSLPQQVSSSRNIFVLDRQTMRQSLAMIAVIVPQYGYQHSITFQCDWVDNGMDLEKGQLFIVAQNHATDDASSPTTSLDRLELLPLEAGRLVYKSPPVRYKMSSLVASFNPKPNEAYQIWCYVGDEMDDLLHLQNMKFHFLTFGHRAAAANIHFFYNTFAYAEDEESHKARMCLRWLDVYHNGKLCS